MSPEAGARPRAAIVSGAAGHLGAAIGRSLAACGLSVLLVDRTSPGLDSVVASLPGGSRCETMTADVTATGVAEEAVRRAVDAFGGLDVLVNGAGIEGPIGRVEELDEMAVRSLFEVNVFALLAFSSAATRHFKAVGGGRIVNLASGAGLAGTAYMAAYSASKHAVIGLTRSMAAELGPDGIPVNAVCPGCVESPMMSRIETRLGELGGGPPASFVPAIPMRRYCHPDEVAQTVAWLATDAPLYITGSALVIDGGLRA